MKISKHIHSCVLIENDDHVILIDPGNYTYEEKGLDVSSLKKLDYLLITHEHPDHMYIPLIKEITKKFPNTSIISNQSVVNLFKAEEIDAGTKENEFIKLKEVPHEKVLDSIPPENTLFNLFDTVTDPGDSLHFDLSKEILLLPIQAPWGSFVAAVEKARELKPKIVIPIHDWHLRDEARKMLCERAQEYLKKFDIRLIDLNKESSVFEY